MTHTQRHSGQRILKNGRSKFFFSIFERLCNSRRIESPWLYTIEPMSEFGLDSLYSGDFDLPRLEEFVHNGTDSRINYESQQLVVCNWFQFHWMLIKIFLSQCLDGRIFDPFFWKNDISVVYITNGKKRKRRSSQDLLISLKPRSFNQSDCQIG